MMKRIVVPVMLLMFVCGLAKAQTKYITHTIAAGETLSALSAKYKTTVGDIMRLNGMNATSKLTIGQAIKIPRSGVAVPPKQTASPAQPATQPPVTTAAAVHTVQAGETLYRIATTYHVKVDQVKAWNNLASDNVSVGQRIYINGNAPADAEQPVVTKPQPVQQQPAQQPVAQQPATQPPAQTPVQQTPPATTPPPPVENKPVVKEEPRVDASKVGSEGYFKSLFGVDVAGRSLESVTGAAMTFKTSSGWSDKKYYILINDIAPGSIVKITYPGSNKTIYAKVLWNMGNLKENEGLNFRISNAAADALGVTELKFQIAVGYYD